MLLDLIRYQHPETAENDYFPLLTTAVNNLEDTIGHLNEIAVINGDTKEKSSLLNLDQYVKKALEGIQASLMEQQGMVINNTDRNLEVLAVPTYLESILLNVLTNAVKYADPKRAPHITIRSGTAKGYTLLSIQDNGLGIDLNFHGDKIFGMFKTFHYHTDARGIGLFMTKNQIESMGGKIQVESEVNKGSTFTLFFKNAKN
jgi:signal transduction histidine kinase